MAGATTSSSPATPNICSFFFFVLFSFAITIHIFVQRTVHHFKCRWFQYASHRIVRRARIFTNVSTHHQNVVITYMYYDIISLAWNCFAHFVAFVNLQSAWYARSHIVCVRATVSVDQNRRKKATNNIKIYENCLHKSFIKKITKLMTNLLHTWLCVSHIYSPHS